MATTVTVDSIFENSPFAQEFILVPAPKLSVTVFENTVKYETPVATGPISPSWRRPSREIG